MKEAVGVVDPHRPAKQIGHQSAGAEFDPF
jgi:hypothetical protein